MARRGHNEGTVYQRKDGRWAAEISLGNGKRKSFYGNTRKEVKDQLTKALRDLQQGLPVAFERQSVDEFLKFWLEQSVKPTVRPGTLNSYQVFCEVHIIPHLGKKQLAKLSPQDVQAFLNKKSAEGLSPRTVQYAHAVLRRALNVALKWGAIGRNPACLVDGPRVPRKEIQPLTPEQASTFLDSVRDDRLYALYVVALSLGLRQGEALGLRWEDIDLEAGTLQVSKALHRTGKKFELLEPKTDRSRRNLTLPGITIAAIREHRKHQLEDRLRAGAYWEDWGLVFCNEIGQPLERCSVTHRFQRALEKAGLPRFRFHDLRHTAATFLLAQGVDLRVVMEVLGHSEIALTANLYTHVLPALKHDAANRMDAMLSR